MNEATIERVLLIDDDPGNNMISKLFVKKVLPGVEIVSFTEPEAGIAYILEAYIHHPIPTILLLDINMPVLNGWQVLEALGKFAEVITRYIKIFILSSSVDPEDKLRAKSIPLVSGYLVKPLRVNTFKATLAGEETDE